MITTLAAVLALAISDQKPLVCAVMNDNPVTAAAAGYEFEGVKFPLCCGGCPAAFQKNPTKYLKASAAADKTVGVDLFDPMTGARIDITKVTVTSDYKGVRYYFASDDEKATFEKSPAKYTKMPSKESLVCPMSGHAIADYGSAAGYVDYKGVRYYACCNDCFPAMQKDIAAVVAGGKGKVAAPAVIMGKNNSPFGKSN